MKLTKRHRLAARLLGEGTSNRETASAVGVSGAAVRKWRKDPEFAALIEEARAEPPRPASEEPVPEDWREQMKGRQARAAIKAHAYLESLVEPGAAKNATGAKAAATLLEFASVQPLEARQVERVEAPADLVALMWGFPLEVLEVVAALKSANPWREPTREEIAAALVERGGFDA